MPKFTRIKTVGWFSPTKKRCRCGCGRPVRHNRNDYASGHHSGKRSGVGGEKEMKT